MTPPALLILAAGITLTCAWLFADAVARRPPPQRAVGWSVILVVAVALSAGGAVGLAFGPSPT